MERGGRASAATASPGRASPHNTPHPQRPTGMMQDPETPSHLSALRPEELRGTSLHKHFTQAGGWLPVKWLSQTLHGSLTSGEGSAAPGEKSVC